MDVRIVELEPIRVASAHGFGTSPETEAWEKLMAWAQRQGLLQKLSDHRFFGFNNPNPSHASPNYGYEQWMTVGPEVQATGDIQTKEFPGGKYAVYRCQGIEDLPPAWQRLVAWVENSRYRIASEHCLEECLTPQFFLPDAGELPVDRLVFDLYLHVSE